MSVELRWATEARKDLEVIDRRMADRIIRKIVWFSEQVNPFRHARPLTGAYSGIFRFRVGEYRVLFEKDDRGNLCILVILRVKHRRDVYR